MFLLRARHRRSITSLALCCWLFAFFLGVVNACEVAGESPASDHVSSHHVIGATPHPHEHDDAALSGCERFCANDVSIPAKATLFLDQPAEQAVLIAPISGAPVVTPDKHVVLLLDHPDPPPAFARYARFLRLAL